MFNESVKENAITVPSVTPTSIANSISIRKVGHVVNATISVTPTAPGFANISTDFPAPPYDVRALGITTGGVVAESWIVINNTGLARVYGITSELNKILLFTITYISKD